MKTPPLPELCFSKRRKPATNKARLFPGTVGYDFRIVSADPSIVLLRPLTSEARNWIYDNVKGERSYVGENLCVEPRFIVALVEGIIAAGLSIAPLK